MIGILKKVNIKKAILKKYKIPIKRHIEPI